MAQLSSKFFCYDHETNTFTAWVSDLGSYPFNSMFKDTVEYGCSIKSAITGSIADFYISLEERDDDKDILAWHLSPTPQTCHLFPLLKDSKVIIFND